MSHVKIILPMDLVRLLNRKAKKKQHFVNPERLSETLPLVFAYGEHITNLQDDWPIDAREYCNSH